VTKNHLIFFGLAIFPTQIGPKPLSIVTVGKLWFASFGWQALVGKLFWLSSSLVVIPEGDLRLQLPHREEWDAEHQTAPQRRLCCCF
jgi:hypothetical protein